MRFLEHNETFVINDIDLSIPPESISVQKEDLVYQWKTLRNKVSTKVASGNGQNIVNVDIAYKYDDILELQRLILSLRETPFCYVENLYLRETFVPNWALSQKMAFTCTDLLIAPYDGASDVFRVSLKLVWFNYYPYLHNWLYRREWATKWMDAKNAKVRYSIGWDIDENGLKAGHRFNVVEEKYVGSGDVRTSEQDMNPWINVITPDGGGSLLEWAANRYNHTHEAEIIEPQESPVADITYTSLYDLMPLPDMMEPSLPVSRPQDSLIYKRFLNFRQRDALKKDFGIDVEADLAGYPNLLKVLFSTYWDSKGEPHVHSLHLPIPDSVGLSLVEMDLYNTYLAEWIKVILKYNNYIKFGFHIYQTVQLPTLIKGRVDGILNGAPTTGNGTGMWIYNKKGTKKYGVRTQMFNEAGFHFPLGGRNGEALPFKTHINHVHEPRSNATYGGSKEKNRFHTGYDLGTKGDTFLAVKKGKVTEIDDRITIASSKWKMANGPSMEVVEGEIDREVVEKDISQAAIISDLNQSISRYLKSMTGSPYSYQIVETDGKITRFTAGFMKTGLIKYFYVGLFIVSADFPDTAYYLDSDSEKGRSLRVDHYDGTVAIYYHWESLGEDIAVDEEVEPGRVLGKVGNASTINSEVGYLALREALNSDTNKKRYVDSKTSDLSYHLHFEYWEKENENWERNPVEDNQSRKATRYTYSGMPNYINVDWQYLQQKWPNETQVPDGTQDGTIVKEELKKEIEQVKEENESDAEILGALDKILLLLDSDWSYYNKASDVRNVWQKEVFFEINKSNNVDVLTEDYLILEGLVFSNFVAGFNNIVSSIPILDHEFPTHQFLGATEPFYNFEFYGIDSRIWQNDSFLFEGLGSDAVNLERVRQLLLENSISYRKIPNSWTVSVDTFITRLFGTYSVPDIMTDEYVEDGEIGVDVTEMKKRAAITRVSSETMAESPGTSRIMLDLLETNTFDQEIIVNQGLTSKDMDDRIEKVLKKLFEFNVTVDPNLEAALALANLLDLDIDLLNDDALEISASFDSSSSGQQFDDSMEGFTKRLNLMVEATSDNIEYSVIGNKLAPLNNSPYLKTSSNGWILDVKAMREAATAETLSKLSYLDYELMIGFVDAIRRAALSAELSIAEDKNLLTHGEIKGSTLTKGEFQAILYNLPVEGKLFRTLYQYLIDISERSGTVSSAFNYLSTGQSGLLTTDKAHIHQGISSNTNYLLPQFANGKGVFKLGNLGYANFSNGGELKAIAQTWSFGLGSLIDDYIWGNVDMPFGDLLIALNELGEKVSGDSEDQAIVDVWSQVIKNNSDDIFEKIRRDYILTLPLYHIALEDYAKNEGLEAINEITGGLIAGLFGESATTSTMLGTQIDTFMRSSGLLAPSSVFRSKPVFYPPGEQFLADTFETNEPIPEVGTNNIFNVGMGGADILNAVLAQMGVIDVDKLLINAQLNRPGSPFKHVASKEEETAKANSYRMVLSRIGLQILSNASILRFLGLEDLYYSETNLFKKGREAYPDLDLPSHPYYRSIYNTYPDFYMWNMYEDGNMYNTEIKKEISKAVGITVQRAYDSIKRLGDGVDARKITGKEEESKLTDSVNLHDLVYRAEGDEGFTTPFYDAEEKSSSLAFVGVTAAGAMRQDMNADNTGIKSLPGRVNKKIPLPPLSTTEGPGAGSLSPLYPSRVSNDKYGELKVEYEKLDTLFGSRAGYLNKDEGYTEKKRLDGLAMPHDVNPKHSFDVESLKQLADQSCADLFGQKRRLARAIPTFKLYIVEEDQQENRLLNFDDFYSYNGVKEFTIVRSKKSAADHVAITLQNVSGSLDGSKRNALSDADYFSNPKLPIADDPTKIGTNKEQSFDSVVLRTGLNVQLRVGYSNDPDLLEVMISGRIVDIQWNDTGDLCQLLVQSFGTELNQLVKNSDEVFYSTHQLLGYLMLQPELMHFGRWEFGRLYQIGEAQDSRLDFFDYEGNSRGHPFSWIESAYDTVRRHPFMFVGALAILAAMDVAPTGSGKGMVGQGFSKATAAIRKLSKNILTAGGRVKFVEKLFLLARGSEEITEEIGKAGLNLRVQKAIAGRGFGPDVSIGPDGIQTRLIGPRRFGAAEEWISADDITEAHVLAELRDLLKSELHAMQLAAARAINISKRITSADKMSAVDAVDIQFDRLFKEIDEIKNLDGGLEVLSSFEREVAHLNWRQMWFSNPWAYVELNGTYWSGIGAKPIKNIIRNTVIGTAAGVTAVMTTSGAAEFFGQIFAGPDSGPFDAILRYFTASQVSLMLSPQDDNIFPPAPTDYMTMDKSWFDKQVLKLNPINWGLIDRQGLVGRYLFDKSPFIKKVDPTACEYMLRNTYIWDVFHEMSLRHPGWVYGARPYGTEFRYTMFFGVPSQRYWSRGVSNQFVDRSNRIYKALQGGVTKAEYMSLYGNMLGDDMSIERYELLYKTQEENSPLAYSESANSPIADIGVISGIISPEQAYTTTLLREYLTGLRHRFEPFRRYHIFSSETDIVKNGLISSEAAPYNSVDVQFSELAKADEDGAEPAVGSLLVKAHSFIPDYMLKTKVDRYYPNCRGWNMAARYGMGQLVHTMKDIYRGEIILLGNPRIRPWDVGILLDHYNDMVGPIEIEQVVDTFSYETGYLTEIKPSAFVVANEISSWPVLEGIKTAVMAIKSIEYDRFGMGPKSLNSFITGPLDWGVGGKFNEDHLKRKVADAFGNDDDLINPTSEIFGYVGEMSETEEFDPKNLAMFSGGIFGVSLLAAPVTGGLSIVAGAMGASGTYAIGSQVLPAINYVTSADALRDLVGGFAIFLECMKGDSVQVIPLTKNGRPIVSGLTVQDPAVLWKNMRGSIIRVVDDHFEGTRDLLDLWNNYSTYLWRMPDWETATSLDENGVNTSVNLTGAVL